MPLNLIRQDITKMPVDAIVNAANPRLAMGGGVSGAIFRAAGADQLQAAANKVAPVETGHAAITPGFNLPAKYVIHAVGPIYRQANPDQSRQLLRSAYTESLRLAVANHCLSIAFPLISSGIYGHPKEQALAVATSAITDFLTDHELDVYLTIFDQSSFVVSQDLLGPIASYIDQHYVDAQPDTRRRSIPDDELAAYAAQVPLSQEPLDQLVNTLDDSFATALFHLIDARPLTDPEVYKRANIDRRLFSKIRSNPDYVPSKRTAIAFAIALHLSLTEANDLLQRAGYTLSTSQKLDVIIMYFIGSKSYNIYRINEVLFSYDLPLLGS
ncbi:macro domain-containing protein [Schleiferilactobacillus harbinensis]|uniref:macro domain-containing protein n=1 Tax=Schleiferilactobacillus harbinensis TaxID=304207 RepID=UPI001AAF15DA|nr:macro domain-containing protein [Schleiferilactobacillus harbinensis]MBO3093082.1 macro domain-containing protein [Schleiferilactobacillus harbinensis]